eukprot:363896-Chlamydomonas_euryale.AAC.2
MPLDRCARAANAATRQRPSSGKGGAARLHRATPHTWNTRSQSEPGLEISNAEVDVGSQTHNPMLQTGTTPQKRGLS